MCSLLMYYQANTIENRVLKAKFVFEGIKDHAL